MKNDSGIDILLRYFAPLLAGTCWVTGLSFMLFAHQIPGGGSGGGIIVLLSFLYLYIASRGPLPLRVSPAVAGLLAGTALAYVAIIMTAFPARAFLTGIVADLGIELLLKLASAVVVLGIVIRLLLYTSPEGDNE